jgi:lipopolysaccharide biosynthesis glycosyltransferase
MGGQNVVLIPAFSAGTRLPFLEYCLNTWEWWCRRTGVRLVIMDRGPDVPYPMRPTWQRYAAFRFLKERGIRFDQMAMVDADTMVSRSCPDFFALTGGLFSAVRDTGRPSWTAKSLRGYAPLFPDTRVRRGAYINAGFIVCSPEHAGFFEKMLHLYAVHRDKLQALTRNLQLGSDQTPLNLLLAREGLDVNFLPGRYNLMHFVPLVLQGGWLLRRYPVGSFVGRGYIWHFIGLSLRRKTLLMKRTWEEIQGDYHV